MNKFEKFNQFVDAWGKMLKETYADKILNLSENGDVLILKSLDKKMTSFHEQMVNLCYMEAGHE